MSMPEMKDRVFVVTGGETGIGRATVEILASEGAIVVIGGILAEEGEKAVASVASMDGHAEFVQTDVRHVEQVDALIDGTVAKYGRIDGLVGNAAIFDGFVDCLGTSDVRGNSTRILGDDAPRMGGAGSDPDWLKRAVPLQRKGMAEETANMILFLLSDKATYMNGAYFVVDGGWTAK